MKINVQASHDKKFTIEVEPADGTGELKEKIGENQQIPPEELRLIFSGRILKEGDTVTSLKMTEGNTIHMVRSGKKSIPITGAAPGSSTASTVSVTTNPQLSPNRPPANIPPGAPPMMMGMSPNALAQMMGSMPPMGAGGPPDMANNPMMGAMLNNPEMMRQTMEMLSANPQLLQTALQMNPAYQNAPPQVQQLMQRPEFLRMVLEMSMAQSGGAGGMPPMSTPPSGMGMETTAMGGAQPPTDEYMQMLTALMGQAPAAAPVVSNEPPEVRFQTQLQQLTEMGFHDPDSNIRALLATGGNVNLAIERLLQNM